MSFMPAGMPWEKGARLQQEARLQEADRGGEAELDDGVRELPRALLAHAVAGQQALRVRQHGCPGDHAPVRGLLLQLLLLMLLHSTALGIQCSVHIPMSASHLTAR